MNAHWKGIIKGELCAITNTVSVCNCEMDQTQPSSDIGSPMMDARLVCETIF
jgi:hypothetical protein